MAAKSARWKKVLVAVIAALAALPLLGLLIFDQDISEIAGVGTGYTAKVMCSSVFVSGRDPREIEKVDLSPTSGYPISVRLDRQKKQVTASILGLFSKRAVYREGLGCTVVVDVSDEELKAQAAAAPVAPPGLSRDLPWPRGGKVDTQNLPSGADRKKLDQALDFAFTDPAPGRPVGTRAVVVVYQGRIIAERYAPGFSSDTPLLGWSMTKSVTNALVGILVRQGRLDIHEPAPVPQWKGPDDPRAQITVDQLLRMESGLKFVEEYEKNIASDVNVMLFNHGDMAAFAADMPLSAEPDSVWSYSSGTSMILARMVRQAVGGTGEDYLAFPRRELFDKLGMSSAVLEPDASGTFAGASYLYASARDWARFGLLFLRDGVWNGERILPQGWVAYSSTPTPAAPHGGYGAQFWLNAGSPGNQEDRWLPKLPVDLYSARGHDGQYVTIIPSHDLVVVRLGFTPNHLQAWDHQKFLSLIIEALGNQNP
ncbi:MAG TPA: serine hydrolase [bacterium]|nr:serine hydrolase [bacterium]